PLSLQTYFELRTSPFELPLGERRVRLQRFRDDLLELFRGQEILLLERLRLHGQQQRHALVVRDLDASLLSPLFNRGRSAVLAEDDVDWLLANEVRRERDVLERILLAAVANPAGDDSRLDLVQLVADDRAVRRLLHLREIHDELRRLDELLR